MALGLARRGARAASRRRSAGVSAPAFRTSATGNDESTGNPSTCTITVPESVEAGDVMFVIGTQNTGGNTFTIAGGGTGVTWAVDKGPSTSSANNMRAYVWSADAVASSKGATITVTSTSGARFPGLLVVLTGVTRTGRVVSDPTFKNTSTTSHNFPSVTVVAANSLLFGLASMRVGTAAPAASFVGGAPAGASVVGESNSAATSSPNMTVSAVVASATVAAGSRTVGTATSTKTATSILYTIALPPA